MQNKVIINKKFEFDLIEYSYSDYGILITFLMGDYFADDILIDLLNIEEINIIDNNEQLSFINYKEVRSIQFTYFEERGDKCVVSYG